jgi:hypothetical protein
MRISRALSVLHGGGDVAMVPTRAEVSMAERPIDLERLAAFLDGRLSAERRVRSSADSSRMMPTRARSSPTPASCSMTLSADAPFAVVPVTTEPVPAPPRVPRRLESRPRRWWPLLALAAAASVAVFALARRPTAADDGASEPTSCRPLWPPRWPSRRDARRAHAGALVRRARQRRADVVECTRRCDSARWPWTRFSTVRRSVPTHAPTWRRCSSPSRQRPCTPPARRCARLHVPRRAVYAARALVSAEAFDTGVWLELLRADAPAARTAPEAWPCCSGHSPRRWRPRSCRADGGADHADCANASRARHGLDYVRSPTRCWPCSRREQGQRGRTLNRRGSLRSSLAGRGGRG